MVKQTESFVKTCLCFQSVQVMYEACIFINSNLYITIYFVLEILPTNMTG
jgi:hypothetical protein